MLKRIFEIHNEIKKEHETGEKYLVKNGIEFTSKQRKIHIGNNVMQQLENDLHENQITERQYKVAKMMYSFLFGYKIDHNKDTTKWIR